MAVIDYIEPWTRRIYLSIETVGVDFQPMDAYKEMRTLRRTNEELRKADLFMKGLGKEPKIPGKFTERFVKLLDGALFVPYDANQALNVIGTVITDDGKEGIDCFDRTLLTATTHVDINYVPLQVEILEIATGGTDPAAVATAVWSDNADYTEGTKGHLVQHSDHIEHTVFINTELAPAIGTGTELTPFGITSNAIDFAELHGFRILGLLANLTIDRAIHNFTAKGVGGVPIVDTNLQNIDKTTFFQVGLKGKYTGEIVARDCTLGNGGLTTLSGEFDNSAIVGDVEVLAGGHALLNRCSTLVIDFVKPTISIGGLAGTAQCSIMGHVGGLTIINMNQATDTVKIIDTGIIEIDSSCTAGNVVIIGLVKPIDNSGPGCTVQWLNLDSSKLNDVWQLMGLDKDNPVTTTQDDVDTGTIHQDISGDGVTTSTIQRTT